MDNDTSTETATRWAAFIRERRTALGIRQIPLAEMVGVTQQTVSRWESGELPPARCHARLIEVLEITPEELHALYQGDRAPAA